MDYIGASEPVMCDAHSRRDVDIEHGSNEAARTELRKQPVGQSKDCQRSKPCQIEAYGVHTMCI